MNEGSSLTKEQNDEKLGLGNRMDAIYNPANNSSQYTSFSSVEIEYLMQRKERSLGDRAIVDCTQTGQRIFFECDNLTTVSMSRATAERYVEEEKRRLLSYASRLLRRFNMVLMPVDRVSQLNFLVEEGRIELAYELVDRHGETVHLLDIYLRGAQHLDPLLDLQRAVSDLSPIPSNSTLIIPTTLSGLAYQQAIGKHTEKLERTKQKWTEEWMHHWRPPKRKFTLPADHKELLGHLKNAKTQVITDISTMFETGRDLISQEFPQPREIQIKELYVLEPLLTRAEPASPENGNEE